MTSLSHLGFPWILLSLPSLQVGDTAQHIPAGRRQGLICSSQYEGSTKNPSPVHPWVDAVLC